MVTRHRVPPTALFSQPHRQPAVLRVDILDRHVERCADPGDGIDHHPDQGAIAQPGRIRRVSMLSSSTGACDGSSTSGHALHEHRRRQDRDSAERIGRQQIAVAGDDQMGTAVDRQLGKFIVGRIAARPQYAR
jgi:hypothetical protein